MSDAACWAKNQTVHMAPRTRRLPLEVCAVANSLGGPRQDDRGKAKPPITAAEAAKRYVEIKATLAEASASKMYLGKLLRG